MPTFSIPLSGLTASSIALSTIANNGAGNAIQQGAGTAVGSIPASFVQGNVDPSGVSTDVAILGDGFFVVSKNGVVSYTRAGDFAVDKTSLLVTSDGQQVLGYPAVNGVVTPGQGLSPLTLGTGAISPATATSQVKMATNLDASAAVGTV